MRLNNFKQSVKQWALTIRKYAFIPVRKNAGTPMLIIMFDNTMQHGGLLDRIKGIITAKMIAGELQYRFGIYTDKHSFDLFRFLKLHNKDMDVKKTELCYNVWQSKPIMLYNIFNMDKAAVLQLFSKRKQQYHFYCNADLLKTFYPHCNAEELKESWRLQFKELFYFDTNFDTVYRQTFLNNTVAGLHLRFQSLLGDSKEGSTILPHYQQTELINSCISYILQIQLNNSNMHLLVVSDSAVFLDCLKKSAATDKQKIIFVPGSIGHIDFVQEDALLQKAILDFYLLSKCTVVYQLLAKEMYNSQFSRYAAMLGNATYKLEKI